MYCLTQPEDQHVIVDLAFVAAVRINYVAPDSRVEVDRLAGGRGGVLDILLVDGRQELLVSGRGGGVARVVEPVDGELGEDRLIAAEKVNPVP